MIKHNNKYSFRNSIVLIMMIAVFMSCKTTKFIPDDRYLLSDIEIELKNENISKDDLRSYLRQEENLKILGLFKFHLWLYGFSREEKKSDWFERIGEPPVIYDLGLTEKSRQQLEQALFNKGYYHAEVKDTVFLKKKKAKVVYSIETGEPTIIRSVQFKIKDEEIASILIDNSDESLLKIGDILNVDVLDEERTRITRLLKNMGFFEFVDDYIHYEVDTALFRNMADLTMILENPATARGDSNPYHKRFVQDNYEVFIDNRGDKGTITDNINYRDTTEVGGIRVYHNGKLPLKMNLFEKSLETKKGQLYSLQKEEKTYNNLYSLRQFKYVNINYERIPYDSLTGRLNSKLYLPLQVKQNYSLDLEGTNTSGNLGVAGNLNYQHRNLFRGAEILDASIKGALERQVAIVDLERMDFNTREFGGQLKLTIPGFLFPLDEQRLNLYAIPFSSIAINYNYQDRPDYTRTIVNSSLSYQWKTSQFVTHTLTPLDLNAVRIFSLNESFIKQIKDLYIKSSYTDHIISASNFSMVFSDQERKLKPDYRYAKLNLEAAGNILWATSELFQRPLFTSTEDNVADNSPYYRFFETRFAQYLKADIDLRYGHRFDKFNALATRVFAGFALPYGNFKVMPFEKRYFTGGANGIRAWQVRSLGPGSYSRGVGEYPNQSSDIKLEANMEYRFRLFWMFEGALFLDAGNIWAINQFDNREGAVFKFNRFYREIALGTGFGIRLVSNYFIVRGDLGMKLRDPALPVGSRWISQKQSINRSDFNFNIAIGYPF